MASPPSTQIDLDVAEGELVSVIGPNGAGKTTLFNLVTGLDAAGCRQRLRLKGTTSPDCRPSSLAALGIARTFQHGRVFGNLSVLDNVLVGAHTRLVAVRPRWPLLGPLGELALALVRPAGWRPRRRGCATRSRTSWPCFGERLLPRVDNPAFSLSYANRRRVEIARALALRPRLLLLDEPTAGMNPTETAEMLEIIRDLKSAGSPSC